MSESRPFAIEAGSKAGSRRNPCRARALPFQALAAQQRSDEMHPSRVVLDATPGVELVGADADVIDPDDLDHLFQAVDVFVEARKEVPDADRSAGAGDRPRVIGADLPAVQRGRTHRLRSPRRPYATAAEVCPPL